jgi:biopolymer transport protein ExbD
VERATITVDLLRKKGERSTRVRLLDTFLGSGEKAFRRLDVRIAAIQARTDELPGFLDADGEVPHADVIRCIDSFRKAGVRYLEFKGAPPPGRDS